MRKKAAQKGDPKVAVAYYRVSTDEQTLGPEAQRATVERWAASNGVRLAGHYLDAGVSGGAPLAKRRELLAALDALGPAGAGLLVVAKRDRLARDVVVAAVIEVEAGKAGARVVSAAGEGDGDDPSAALMRRLVDAFAEYERALIRARTRAALDVKRARGEALGNTPFGTRRAGRMLEPNEREEAAVSMALALRAEGLSQRAIVRRLSEMGHVGRTGRPLGQTQVSRLFRRR